MNRLPTYFNTNKEKLSLRLLFWILLLSSVFTLLATSIQLYSDYRDSRRSLDQSLAQIEVTSLPAVSVALWTINKDILQSIASGLLSQRDIGFIKVIDSDGIIVIQLGETEVSNPVIKIYPVMFTHADGKPEVIGQLIIVATLTQIYRQLKNKVMVILLTQGTKTFLMSVCILLLIDRLVIRSLNGLAAWASGLALDNLEQKLQLPPRHSGKGDAIDRVADALTTMQFKMQKSLAEKREREQQIIALNESLEQKVRLRTREMEQSLNDLKQTQAHLIESEKMAALGALVAGVAHEVNTPLGVGVTAASYLADRLDKFRQKYKSGKLSRRALDELLLDAQQSTDLLLRNLTRAGQLISCFKQVAADQGSEQQRCFELRAYVEEVVQSLRGELKQGGHQVSIHCRQKITLNSYPGVLAQVLTNLIMNSLIHGFQAQKGGEIDICLTFDGVRVVIDYHDNGSGLNPQQRDKVFEPFYTTKRHTECLGLGMSITYNLLVSKLNGCCRCLDPAAGAHFQLAFPADVNKAAAG